MLSSGCQGDLDDKQAAVKMKMFGQLTRETFEWYPDKLLCKRFNVPDPYPGYATQIALNRLRLTPNSAKLKSHSDWSCRSGIVGLPKVKRDKFSVFNFLTVTESREAAGNFIHTQEALKSFNRLSHSSRIFCKRTFSPFSCFFNLKA